MTENGVLAESGYDAAGIAESLRRALGSGR